MGSPISHLLNTTVTYKEILGTDGNGDPVLSNPVCIPAYVDRVRKMVRNSRGEEVVTTTIITSDCRIPEQSIIWLADQDVLDDSQCKEPLSVAQSPHPLQPDFMVFEAAL